MLLLLLLLLEGTQPRGTRWQLERPQIARATAGKTKTKGKRGSTNEDNDALSVKMDHERTSNQQQFEDDKMDEEDILRGEKHKHNPIAERRKTLRTKTRRQYHNTDEHKCHTHSVHSRTHASRCLRCLLPRLRTLPTRCWWPRDARQTNRPILFADKQC